MLRFIKKGIELTDFLKKHGFILLTEILIITVFCLFYGRFGDINIDSFREAYIPEQIINGKVLYKNIFCIYPPLGYLINAFLFKVFGVNLSVLYISGLFSAMGIFYFINKISKMFFNDFLSAGIIIFLIAGFVLSPNVFNSFFPYSYGILYGLLFALASIYFGLNKKYPLAYLLCSLAVCSKAEFLPLLPILILLSKKENIGKNSALFILPPIIILCILFTQGVKISDLLTSLGLIKLIGSSNTLNEFYSSMGLVPRWEHLQLYLVDFIKFILPVNWSKYQEVLIWVFPVITLCLAFRFKKLTKNEIFFITASVLVSLKVFFALTLQSYGVYYLGFALISLGILLNKHLRKVFAVYLILWGLIIGFNNTKSLLKKDFTIQNKKGIIKTFPKSGEEVSKLMEVANKFTASSKIVIYPENLAVNYFTGIKSDDKFYSLIPLYVETFGEENIIKRLENTRPDYIMVTDYDTFAYGPSKFGEDYAINVKKYIDKNYKQVEKNIYKK